MIIETREKVDFEKVWQEGMKDWSGKMPERMVNDALEEQFWAQYIEKMLVKRQILMQRVSFKPLQSSLSKLIRF